MNCNSATTYAGCRELTESSESLSDIDRYLTIVRDRLESTEGVDRLVHQWRFLEDIGLDEFYGCDINIIPFLDQIPPGSDIVDIRSYLQHSLVEALLDQLDSERSTVLLDVEKMKKTPAEILIPRIQDLRRKEIRNSQVRVKGRIYRYYDVFMNEIEREVIPFQGQTVNLEDLWLTAVGYQILSKAGVGIQTDLQGLRKIEKSLNRIEIPIKIDSEQNPIERNKIKISEALRNLILSQVPKYENHEEDSKRFK